MKFFKLLHTYIDINLMSISVIVYEINLHRTVMIYDKKITAWNGQKIYER